MKKFLRLLKILLKHLFFKQKYTFRFTEYRNNLSKAIFILKLILHPAVYVFDTFALSAYPTIYTTGEKSETELHKLSFLKKCTILFIYNIKL